MKMRYFRRFRGWNKKTNDFAPTYYWTIDPFTGDAYWNHDGSKADIVVTQSTGHFDKNNEEVFEKDMIKGIAIGLDSKKFPFSGIVKWDEEDASFYCETIDFKWPHIKMWFIKDMEIIGNTFESAIKG